MISSSSCWRRWIFSWFSKVSFIRAEAGTRMNGKMAMAPTFIFRIHSAIRMSQLQVMSMIRKTMGRLYGFYERPGIPACGIPGYARSGTVKYASYKKQFNNGWAGSGVSVYLPNTFFNKSETRAAGSFLILVSSSAIRSIKPLMALLHT